MNKIFQGDCLEVLKELEDNSVDSIVCDPPYELGFMGKSWDNTGIANNKDMWAECLRVLKPGGHLLAFSGTRTYHRMAVAIEDAGFEVRDMIEWVYGSGFPKSLNVGKQVNKLETDEWSKIGKALDNIDQKSIMEIWKRDALFATIKLSKSIIEVGINTPKSFFVPDIAVLYHNPLNEQLSAIFAELKLSVLNHISEENEIIVQKNVGQITIPSLNLARYAVKLSQSLGVLSWSIFTAECDVKEWLNENTEVNHKVDEALKTLRGNKKYSNEEIISVLCVVITNALKHTILNQSKTFQNLDTNQKMECASAINVIITEYTAENLISNTVAILKSKAVDKMQGNEREVVGEKRTPDGKTWSERRPNGDITGYTGNGTEQKENTQGIETKGTSEWEGWGTALKPAHEPICMARKPISEKTVAENCLKWGTGGINIDKSRVGTEGGTAKGTFPNEDSNGIYGNGLNGACEIKDIGMGRFPANLIHDGSDEVVECFPETNASKSANRGLQHSGRHGGLADVGGNIKDGTDTVRGHDDNGGNASRFFKSIIYQAKASKSERNKGCDGLEEKESPLLNGQIRNDGTTQEFGGFSGQVNRNNHPTVKPIALMEYLIKMVTPKGGIVLDPFAGSGSTLVAAKQNGFKYIGIEMTEEYIPIIEARLNSIDDTLFSG